MTAEPHAAPEHAGPPAPVEAYPWPKHGWTCFFCGETFMTQGAARDHFGAEPFSDPGCQIKAGDERGLLMALREAEAELARYRADDTDSAREYHRLIADAAATERKAEEEGYARALRDVEAGKVEPEHAERILAALRALPAREAGEAPVDEDDPVTMAIAALKCSVAAGKDIIAVSSFAEVALAYLTGHGGDYTAYREAQGASSGASHG